VLLTCLSVPELRLARVPALVFYLLICLSAVYLQHHYVCDVLLGTLYVAVLWTISGALRPRAVES
jgi:membrane-associated phospholipid phosphatase